MSVGQILKDNIDARPRQYSNAMEGLSPKQSVTFAMLATLEAIKSGRTGSGNEDERENFRAWASRWMSGDQSPKEGAFDPRKAFGEFGIWGEHVAEAAFCLRPVKASKREQFDLMAIKMARAAAANVSRFAKLDTDELRNTAMSVK